MKLSAHFTLAELTVSQEAVRRGWDNKPGPTEFENLKRLAATLELVRALGGGRPLVISSGYRSLRVNRAVGSSDTSAHRKGLAADFTIPGIGVRALCLLIRESGIEYDQLIYEGGWVHLGLADGKMRREERTAIFKEGEPTRYPMGIL